MSLSQKHVGKIFVPWFNTAEWKQVYNILFLQLDKNYNQALNILKVWKYRTPLLSAGVEGTLIILEALSTEKEPLSEHQLTQIYAISLIRFLNLCATNNDRQGTFYQMAIKNELPKWLINIRHDIAHDHKLPSLSVLELGLSQCLEWIKNKYWEVHKETLTDYVVTEDSRNTRIIEILKIYVQLNLNMSSKNIDVSDYDENIIEKINDIIFKRSAQPTTDISDIISILEEFLSDGLTVNDIDKKLISNILVYKALLCTETEITPEETHFIPKDFRSTWSNLLNMLNENNFISVVLNELLDVTNNIELTNDIRLTAAIWISELIMGLQKVQLLKEELANIQGDNSIQLSKSDILKMKSVLEENYPEYEDSLDFYSINDAEFTNMQKFQEKILDSPNNYTLCFLERVLQFNKNSENYILDTTNVVKNMLLSNEQGRDGEIFTVDHLEVLSNFSDTNMDTTDTTEETIVVDLNDHNLQTLGPRWKLVKDTSSYKECPLGVLPNQDRNKNPQLTF